MREASGASGARAAHVVMSASTFPSRRSRRVVLADKLSVGPSRLDARSHAAARGAFWRVIQSTTGGPTGFRGVSRAEVRTESRFLSLLSEFGTEGPVVVWPQTRQGLAYCWLSHVLQSRNCLDRSWLVRGWDQDHVSGGESECLPFTLELIAAGARVWRKFVSGEPTEFLDALADSHGLQQAESYLRRDFLRWLPTLDAGRVRLSPADSALLGALSTDAWTPQYLAISGLGVMTAEVGALVLAYRLRQWAKLGRHLVGVRGGSNGEDPWLSVEYRLGEVACSMLESGFDSRTRMPGFAVGCWILCEAPLWVGQRCGGKVIVTRV